MTTSKAQTTIKSIDEGVLIERTQDVEPIIDDVRERQSSGQVGSTEMRHVGRIPTVVLEDACQKLGVDMTDREAVREVIYNKITSGAWSKFQVHKRGY